MSEAISPPVVDVNTVNSGTIVTFYLNTPVAKEWAAHNVEAEDYMKGGDWNPESSASALFHVEHRFANPIADGMSEAGLLLEHA